MDKKILMPPMGWNSYDYYDTTVTEQDIKEHADYMAAYLKEYGWEYIVVDIEWAAREAGLNREQYQYVPFGDMAMDEYSRLVPCENRFPSAANGAGFKPLADYVHQKGLKFGIHIMRGIPRYAAHNRMAIKGTTAKAHEIADPYNICEWNPGMYGLYPDQPGAMEYYQSLIDLYAEWGVDFIKCDDICRLDAVSAKKEIEMLHKAIENSKRDIVLSLSPGPALVELAAFYYENAEMWRITDDFWDNWPSLRNMFDRCRNWQNYVKTGGYPDCDMLPFGTIGKGFQDTRTSNFTFEEQRTVMSLWCIFRSPLMLGANLPMLDEKTLSLLTNKDVLSLLSDAKSPREIYRDNEKIIWKAKSYTNDSEYIALFNIAEESIGVIPEYYMRDEHFTATDLWNKNAVDHTKINRIKSHDVLLIKCSR